ncbi:MAG: tetratricopeptide repeat protein [Syntrophobacteria bacterium]
MDEIVLHIHGMEINALAFVVVVAILGAVVGYYFGKRQAQPSSFLQVSSQPENYTAFLQGIHYILANETDQAIEAFTRAVQINSETIETYIALGNLFRAKGEIDRAIRIRQSILLRHRVDEETKLQALFDLGMDYRQGGFLQRAISTFQEVIRRAPQRVNAYVQLEALYEATRDWRRAYELQQEICKLSKKDENHILAHLQTEQAKVEMKAGNVDAAKGHLKKALSLDPHCVDARLHLGELYWLKNKEKKALHIWRALIRNNSQWAHLVLARLEKRDGEEAGEDQLLEFFTTLSSENLDATAQLALARCFLQRNCKDQGIAALRRALTMEPNLQEARKLLGEALLEDGDHEGVLDEYRDLLQHLPSPVERYRCQHCGFELDEVQWKCPRCQKWDSIQPKKASTS